jgi:hypothetical protein
MTRCSKTVSLTERRVNPEYRNHPALLNAVYFFLNYIIDFCLIIQYHDYYCHIEG